MEEAKTELQIYKNNGRMLIVRLLAANRGVGSQDGERTAVASKPSAKNGASRNTARSAVRTAPPADAQ